MGPERRTLTAGRGERREVALPFQAVAGLPVQMAQEAQVEPAIPHLQNRGQAAGVVQAVAQQAVALLVMSRMAEQVAQTLPLHGLVVSVKPVFPTSPRAMEQGMEMVRQVVGAVASLTLLPVLAVTEQSGFRLDRAVVEEPGVV